MSKETMYKFSPSFVSVAPLVRWFVKCADGSLKYEDARPAFEAKDKIERMFKSLNEHSEALEMAYNEKVYEFKKANPNVNLEEVTPPELQKAFQDMRKEQSQIGDEVVEVELSSKEFMALTTAVENILKNIYGIFEKQNKGEKFDPKKERIPTSDVFFNIQKFAESLESATQEKS